MNIMKILQIRNAVVEGTIGKNVGKNARAGDLRDCLVFLPNLDLMIIFTRNISRGKSITPPQFRKLPK